MKPELSVMIIILAAVFALSLLCGTSVHASSSTDDLSSTKATNSSSPSSSSSSSSTTTTDSNCVTFDSEARVITITCSATDLTHVNDQLKDTDVLTRDNSFDKGWILNAGITIAQNANTLHQF